MKKMICILGCVTALMLAGCQTQHDPPDTEMDAGKINPSGSSNVGVPSANIPVNTETDTNQTDGKDNLGTDTPSDDDPVNADADTNQTGGKDNPNTDTPSKEDPANAPTQPAPISGDISSIENDSSGAATLDERGEERELKNEGSLRGEIEVTHKLPVGKMELSEGDTVLFHVEVKSADAELKITLTGAGTGTTLEGSVTGSGDIFFEIDTAEEYTVVLENCSLRGVKFTIDYSIGGFI